MRNISLAFDLEDQKDGKGEYKPARLPEVPDLPAYMSYCIFPGTTVFGPFLTYAEHCKFLHPTPLVSPIDMYILSNGLPLGSYNRVLGVIYSPNGHLRIFHAFMEY